MTGLDRAKADLAAGDPRRARQRLTSLVAAHPYDLEVRRLLAEAYRSDRQPAQAGRWGYLVAAHATDRERRAFERHNSFAAHDSRVTESRLRKLLRVDDLGAVADHGGRALLRELPRRRPPGRRDRPMESLRRLWATRRARSTWR